MANPKNKQQQVDQELRYQRRINIVFLCALIFLGVAVWRIPNSFLVYTAPDVTKAYLQKVGEKPLQTVYGFAQTVWEQLNYCESDCGKEFLVALDKNKAYFTKSCQFELKRNFEKSKSLYSFRSRILLPTEDAIYDPQNIQQMSNDLWYVKLKYNLKDEVSGQLTRDNITLYPLKVIRSGKPLSANPLGMEIDCYFGNGPVVLERRTITEEK